MRNPPIPTRKEIAAACREIQATWTPAERLHRSRSCRADGRPILIRIADTTGVEKSARAAAAKRLERRRGAMEALSLLAALRRHAEAAGLIERVEPDEPGGDVFEIGWELAEEER